MDCVMMVKLDGAIGIKLSTVRAPRHPSGLFLCDGPCERILRSCNVLKHLLTTLTTASGHASQCGTCGGALTALDACGGALKALDA